MLSGRTVKKVLKFSEAKSPREIKLDLGTGKGNARPDGFVGVDRDKYDGVKHIVDLGRDKWPWRNNSVDEAQAIYLVHYLDRPGRIHFTNELHRVLKPGAKCIIHTPHEFAAKAYGDLAAEMPPVTEAWYYFLNADWRAAQGHTIKGYTCDFDIVIGYGMHQAIATRSQEYQQDAMQWHKEAVQELVVTLTKR